MVALSQSLKFVPYPEAPVHLLPQIKSSIMSSSSSSEYHDATPVPHCLCRVRRLAVRRTAWSERNPGHRFYNCSMSLTAGDCKFFDWCDPPLNTHYKELILRLRNEANGNALAEVEQKLEVAQSRLASLKVKFANLKEKSNLEVGRLKAQCEALNLRAKVLGVAFGSLVMVNGVMLLVWTTCSDMESIIVQTLHIKDTTMILNKQKHMAFLSFSANILQPKVDR
ncbi:hypothetical protein LXL04_005142 [Taraxacum kok-saghyz]